MGFLNRFEDSAAFQRRLPRKAAICQSVARSEDMTEVLETGTATRTGKMRQEVWVKWTRERQPQWISGEQLLAALPENDLVSILGSDGA